MPVQPTQQAVPDAFDVAAGQMSAPSPQQQPTSQPNQPSTQGDVFDQAASQMQSGTVTGAGTTSPATSSVPDALHIDQSDNPALKFAKGVNAFGAGAGDGLLSTANGLADMLHLPHATLQQRQQQLEHDNAENPILNSAGKGTETLLEFLSGDEALKGLSLSKRLAASSRIAEALENSPRVMRAFHVGAEALRGGVVGGAQGTVRSGGDLKQGAEEGATTAALTGVLGTVPTAVKAIRGALEPAGIQKPLQDSIRAVLSDVADFHGLNAPTSASIRDVVQDVGNQVREKASSVYKQLDTISGGEAQRFRNAAENVASKLREITGLDDEQEAKLVAQQQKIDTAHKAMLDKLEAAGHPRDLLKQADSLWNKQAAISDLNNSIRQSTTGMRPELAGANASAETVNPKTLFVKLNRLHNSGRLTQAIGPGNAQAILEAVDAAYVRSQKIAANNRWAGMAAKAGASVGLGGLGYGVVHVAHELLGQ